MEVLQISRIATLSEPSSLARVSNKAITKRSGVTLSEAITKRSEVTLSEAITVIRPYKKGRLHTFVLDTVKIVQKNE